MAFVLRGRENFERGLRLRCEDAFALPAAVQETFKEMLNKGLAS